MNDHRAQIADRFEKMQSEFSDELALLEELWSDIIVHCEQLGIPYSFEAKKETAAQSPIEQLSTLLIEVYLGSHHYGDQLRADPEKERRRIRNVLMQIVANRQSAEMVDFLMRCQVILKLLGKDTLLLRPIYFHMYKRPILDHAGILDHAAMQ